MSFGEMEMHALLGGPMSAVYNELRVRGDNVRATICDCHSFLSLLCPSSPSSGTREIVLPERLYEAIVAAAVTTTYRTGDMSTMRFET